MTALLSAYRTFAALALPFLARHRVSKLRRAGVVVYRAHETLGHATQEKPLGDLVWIHAASVGETKSALALIERMLTLAPMAQVLVTSGTATSAEVMEQRLPARAIHQFAPLDGVGPVTRFLDHWSPRLAVFIESELWPNLIRLPAERGIPLALLNARLSKTSRKRWAKFPDTARAVLGTFGIIHVQDIATEDALHDLGLTHARRGVNLKSVLPAPHVDEDELWRLQEAFGARPIWSAVSTHPGEDEIIIDAHTRLRAQHPDAALVLVPRHPERADSIRRLCGAHVTAQRSTKDAVDKETSIYIADTLGETDLWFTLAPLVCLCGSFSDVGGHTPFEPALAGAAILHGPLYANFADVYAQFDAVGAAMQVQDAESLTVALDTLIRHPEHARAMGAAARPLAAAGQDKLDALARQCLTLAGIDHD